MPELYAQSLEVILQRDEPFWIAGGLVDVVAIGEGWLAVEHYRDTIPGDADFHIVPERQIARRHVRPRRCSIRARELRRETVCRVNRVDCPRDMIRIEEFGRKWKTWLICRPLTRVVDLDFVARLDRLFGVRDQVRGKSNVNAGIVADGGRSVSTVSPCDTNSPEPTCVHPRGRCGITRPVVPGLGIGSRPKTNSG
jgi:hypothetical protein